MSYRNDHAAAVARAAALERDLRRARDQAAAAERRAAAAERRARQQAPTGPALPAPAAPADDPVGFTVAVLLAVLLLSIAVATLIGGAAR
ncbi:MAG: hypothetical protein JNK64_40915 [Myxococcales bacterium]|nr:hypothetical protein [Myxococcales bacterium]